MDAFEEMLRAFGTLADEPVTPRILPGTSSDPLPFVSVTARRTFDQPPAWGELVAWYVAAGVYDARLSIVTRDGRVFVELWSSRRATTDDLARYSEVRP